MSGNGIAVKEFIHGSSRYQHDFPPPLADPNAVDDATAHEVVHGAHGEAEHLGDLLDAVGYGSQSLAADRTHADRRLG